MCARVPVNSANSIICFLLISMDNVLTYMLFEYCNKYNHNSDQYIEAINNK